MTEITYIDVETLQNFMNEVFVGVGVPEDEARICADVLIAADLQGISSHGVQRLKPYYYDQIKAGIQSPTTKVTIVKGTPTTARLDAGHGMGQVASYRAMELAIQKAKEYGTGAVAVGNSTHFGIAGYYPLMAIQEGLIGFSMTNTRPSIAPTFGVEPMMGTNPLTIGIPTDEPFPFLIDCATSIVPRGRIEVYKRTASPIPEGWVINEKGDLVTDSVQIMKDLTKCVAALVPLGGIGETFGGHKGYGYAVAVEILTAALWGGPFMQDLTDAKGHRLGHFFLAINPASFIELEAFKKVAGDICRALRASKKVPGHDRIYTAGEKEYYTELERRKTGIPINESILKELIAINTELGLNYSFNYQ